MQWYVCQWNWSIMSLNFTVVNVNGVYWLTCTKEICYFDGNGANPIFPYLFCCCQSSCLGFLSLPSLGFRTYPWFVHWNVNINLWFAIASLTCVQCITTFTCNFVSLTNKLEAQLTINFNVVLLIFWSASGFDRGSLFPRLPGSASSTWWRCLTVGLFIKSRQPPESAVRPDNIRKNVITLLPRVSVGITLHLKGQSHLAKLSALPAFCLSYCEWHSSISHLLSYLLE